MFKNFRDRIALSGITVLLVGIALLIFTFVSAYGFLSQSFSIIPSDDLVQTFGAALAPLIGTCIRIMYLGVMGWVGSLVTIRGVTIIAHAPQTQTGSETMMENRESTKLDQRLKAGKAHEEARQTEPEFVVIPPEQVSQPKESKDTQEEPLESKQ
jgi:uncharacterized membrane protein YdfJ with MMPL/SSD domain